MRPNRAVPLLLAIVLTPFALPLAAIDGELDTDDFHPPFGRIGFVGGGLVADGGLVAPDGMAVALMRDDGAEVRWRQVPPDTTPGTWCSITPQFATEARYRDGLFDSQGRLVLVGTATYPGLGDVLFEELALRVGHVADCRRREPFPLVREPAVRRCKLQQRQIGRAEREAQVHV